MERSFYFKDDEPTILQILQFDEMIAILKQVVLESSKDDSFWETINKDAPSCDDMSSLKIKKKKLDFILNPETF